MGLDVYLYKADRVPTNKDLDEDQPDFEPFKETEIEFPSKLHPEHYFKVGYFRSSYNESGINTVMRNWGGMDLYDIFDVDIDYIVTPDWQKALKKVNKALEKYEKHLSSPNGKYSITTMYNFRDGVVNDAAEAFDIFKKERERNCSFDSYSCSNGTFYMGNPLKLVGFINGKSGETFLVYENEEDKLKDNWYYKALEIVKETIEYVLDQKDGMKYYFHWSS
jgi:hypothetical protein